MTSVIEILSMDNEELRELAMQKDCFGNATGAALLAQNELADRSGNAIDIHNHCGSKLNSDEYSPDDEW